MMIWLKKWGQFLFSWRKNGTVPISLILLLLVSANVRAGDDPFTGPANWGGTGLMETPTARVLREGRFRFGASQMDPYRYYYGAFSPLKGLEIEGRFTEVMGVQGMATETYGDFKDKAIDLKYQFLPEGKYWPALTLGIMDTFGTRVYAAQYLVASKQIYPFDFTFGFGNGRYGKSPLSSSGETVKAEIFSDNGAWRTDGQFFGGIQFAATNWLTVMAEYSQIKYEKQTTDPAQAKYFQQAVSSPVNFGIRLKPWDWLEADISYQRGNQIGGNLSFTFEFGQPLVPIYDKPYREKPEYRMSPPAERIARALDASGFSNIGVRISGEDLWVEAQNDQYYYTPRALGAMLRVAADFMPDGVQRIYLSITAKGIPVVAFMTTREDLKLFLAEQLTAREFLHVSDIRLDGVETLDVKKTYRNFFDWGFKPEFNMYLNSREGFFKYRAGLSGWLEFITWRGGSWVAGLEWYPVNDVPVENITPDALQVRGDVALYKSQNVVLGTLMFNQKEKFRHEIYGRVSAGMLDYEYGGVDVEVAKPLFGGRLMIGLNGAAVKKRDPNIALKFKENDFKDYYTTAFVNTRLNLPEIEASIDLRTGQFLAGDQGTRVTLSKFFNGVVLSAWYSFTNTDLFSDSYNRGYHDKGIAITIPMRLFEGRDSRTTYYQGITAWTRDVAQDINHFDSLFDFIGRNSKIYIDKDRGMIQ